MRRLTLLVALLALAVAPAAGAAPAKDEKSGRADGTPGAPTAREHGPRPTGTPGETGPSSPGREGPVHSPVRVAPMFRDVTEEDIADILAFLGENMPWARVELERVREAEPDHFRQACRHMRFEIAQLRQLKERDPEAFRKIIEEKQLKSRAQDLATKAREAADPAERDAFTAELRKVLDRLFDVELANREVQIRQLEQRLDSLKQELKDRAANREQVIKTRLEDALKGKKDPEFKFGDEPRPSQKREKPEKERADLPEKK
jgi:hypothetical protein